MAAGQQDFADGTTQVYERQVRAAGKGEPFPFDGSVFGDDRTGSLGSVSYAFLLSGSKVVAPGDVVRSVRALERVMRAVQRFVT